LEEYKSILFDYCRFLNENQENVVVKEVEVYINQHPFFRVISDLLPSAMYIVDYRTNEYLYVADSCKKVLGFDKQDFYDEGRKLSVSRIHPEDLKIYSSEIFKEFIKKSNSISKEDLPFCRFSLSLRYQRKDGVYIKGLQQFVILETTDEGFPVIALGIMSDITAFVHSDKVVFSILKCKDGETTTLFTSENKMRTIGTISIREQEVLVGLLNGLTSKALSEKLFLSLHTINAHRRNLLRKTNSKNTFELIEFAIQHGIS
jgi:DNA-binding CsgD family transcriptional regulator